MTGPVEILGGDCLAVLDDLPEASVDAIVTDPPYHLTSIVKRFGGSGSAPAGEGTDGAFRRASRGFMGKEWDGGDIAFRVETWAAVLRVLKPGGHLVAFNHSRTWHRMAVAIEDAGAELRDSILDLYDAGAGWPDFLGSLNAAQMAALRRVLASSDGGLLAWLYGTGFPKSHDVAAGIDKLRDDLAEIHRVTAWIAEARDRAGLKNRAIDDAFGFNGMAGHWTSQGAQAAVPTPEQWARLVQVLGAEAPAEVADLVDRLNGRKGEPGEAWQSAPVVEEFGDPAGIRRWAARYAGQDRPDAGVRRASNSEAARAWEGWGTALKPAFEPIVLARKPLAEGSVARQVLATGTGAINIGETRIPSTGKATQSGTSKAANGWGAAPSRELHPDRWPANVVTDGAREVRARFPVDGEGSVARFFYSAKADAADRRGSDHPTVKPHALMRWLVRLVTPRGGVVLDPFGGSGATAWAAAVEGRRAVLIEREAEYLADLRRNATRLAGNVAEAESTWAAEIEALAAAAEAQGAPAEAERLRKRLDKPHPDDLATRGPDPAAALSQADLFGG